MYVRTHPSTSLPGEQVYSSSITSNIVQLMGYLRSTLIRQGLKSPLGSSLTVWLSQTSLNQVQIFQTTTMQMMMTIMKREAHLVLLILPQLTKTLRTMQSMSFLRSKKHQNQFLNTVKAIAALLGCCRTSISTSQKANQSNEKMQTLNYRQFLYLVRMQPQNIILKQEDIKTSFILSLSKTTTSSTLCLKSSSTRSLIGSLRRICLPKRSWTN